MFHSPQIDECLLPIAVPDAPSLKLRAWEFRLSTHPDPANGETDIVTIPPEVGEGYVAIVWDGEVDIVGGTPSGANCLSGDRIYSVTAGTEITPKNDLPARVAIVGIDHVERPIGPLRRGTHPFSETRLDGRTVTFILRVLDFTGVVDEVALEDWPRPGFLLTMIDGPRICGLGDPTNPIRELDFVHLPKDEPALICAGSESAPIAYLFDFYVNDDVVSPRIPVNRIEQGCRLRCWGGGL